MFPSEDQKRLIMPSPASSVQLMIKIDVFFNLQSTLKQKQTGLIPWLTARNATGVGGWGEGCDATRYEGILS